MDFEHHTEMIKMLQHLPAVEGKDFQIHDGQASFSRVEALDQLAIVWVKNVVDEAGGVFNFLIAFHVGASFGL